MRKSEQYAARLRPLLEDPRRGPELERLLTSESGLPGPRGNLELAEGFRQAVCTTVMPAAWLATLYGWAATDAQQAPTGDPREFLAFCAVLAFGTLYHTHECCYPCSVPCDCPHWLPQCEQLTEAIHAAARDPRWRLREAAAMSLQHLGEEDPRALKGILVAWLKGDSLLDHRAVLAALAHPPALRRADTARFALRAGETVLKKLAALPPARRSGEEFRVLVKGLSYALSVFVAALPQEGLALVDRWAAHAEARGDKALQRVIAANRGKRRVRALAGAGAGRSPRG